MWNVRVMHYRENEDGAFEENVFTFETKVECIAFQEALKYLTKWNGGEPVISSTYWKSE